MKLVYDFDIVLLHWFVVEVIIKGCSRNTTTLLSYATALWNNGSLILYGPALTKAYSRLT
jgi:hypothetical protein